MWIAKLIKMSNSDKESKLTAYANFLEKGATITLKFKRFNWDFYFNPVTGFEA